MCKIKFILHLLSVSQSLLWVLEVQKEITEEADSLVAEIDTHNPNYK